MHDIGRTVREMYEAEQEQGFDHEHDYETLEEGGYTYEFDQEWDGEYAYETDLEDEMAVPFNDAQETQLAYEFLEAQTEEELDQFIGKLISRVAPRVRNFARSNAGRALGRVLRGVAKRALPVAGKVVGGMFGGPVGAKIGGGIGRFASRAFGLELEGLSPEDQELALGKAFVRFAGAAARQVQKDGATRTQPRRAVRAGVVQAARRFAPGLLVPMPGAYRTNRHKGVYDHRDYEGNWAQEDTALQEF